MLRRRIVLCIFTLILVKFVEMDSTEIKLNLNSLANNVSCDHTTNRIQEYTALEQGHLTFKIIYKNYINFFSCTDFHDEKKILLPNPDLNRTEVTVHVTKEMGTSWKCTIRTNKNNPNIYPIVTVGNDSFTMAYCYMKVHVRRTTSPQTVLVNNMVVDQVRTDLSVKDVDFTVQYEYADSDLVNVTCHTFNISGGQLYLQYNYADRLSNEFNSSEISSDLGIGVRATLHYAHNNTHMICRLEEDNDKTTVMITFVMRSKFNSAVNLEINGMMLRLSKRGYNNSVKYKYIKDQPVFVVCRVDRPDIKLSVDDKKISYNNKSYKKIFNGGKKSVMASFSGSSIETMMCLADDKYSNHVVDIIVIDFIPEDRLTDRFPLQMDLPASSTVMELYEINERRIIYYEFEEGDSPTLNCYKSSSLSELYPVSYLKFNDSDNRDEKYLAQTLHLNGKDGGIVKSCCLTLVPPPKTGREKEEKLREIVVIFRQKIMTTTTSTTLAPIILETLAASPTGNVPEYKDANDLVTIALGVIITIVIIAVAIIIHKLRKRNHAQGGPYERNYENLQNQSEGSIPAHPVQWESNYAAPVDLRPENETYSLPYKPEADMYATPIPKSERTKNITDPNYANLELKSASGQRNVIKDTDDPNYSEISKKLEDCYAKVLPKIKRNVHNENAYANIGKESPYANTVDEPEPMYCDPNTALKTPRGQCCIINIRS